jgi:CHASE3 domain sensor protein
VGPVTDTAGFSSPVEPRGRWGRGTAQGRDFRAGSDGRLYSEEHAAANAERARQAERAAREAQALAARRLKIALVSVLAVLVVVVLLLITVFG